MSTPRDLPRIDDLLGESSELVARYGRESVTTALREIVERTRAALLDGQSASTQTDTLIAEAAGLLAAQRPQPLRRVINATGVVVHTNLGRAPLSRAAVTAMAEAAGVTDLEYDLGSGRRGSRGTHIDPLVAQACGAADGMAVNNAAAALVLTLAALAGGRGVLVSRGELVEIGGSFRLPDIMAASGARLIEVGTTNRTRAADYARAADKDGDVAMILKVHPSNFSIDGFTETASLQELSAIGAARKLPVVYDVGSGLLGQPHGPTLDWLGDEPTMRGALDAGASLAICSGDKLLGGPQAGLIAGDATLVSICRQHALARALRLDKLRIAALHATLDAHLRDAASELPVWRMLTLEPQALRTRAQALVDAVGAGEVTQSASVAGGGSAPGATVASPVVRISHAHPDRIARQLRHAQPPLIVRVEDNALWLDPRTIDEADDALVAQLLREALSA